MKLPCPCARACPLNTSKQVLGIVLRALYCEVPNTCLHWRRAFSQLPDRSRIAPSTPKVFATFLPSPYLSRRLPNAVAPNKPTAVNDLFFKSCPKINARSHILITRSTSKVIFPRRQFGTECDPFGLRKLSCGGDQYKAACKVSAG